jgi:hypothetical protein
MGRCGCLAVCTGCGNVIDKFRVSVAFGVGFGVGFGVRFGVGFDVEILCFYVRWASIAV